MTVFQKACKILAETDRFFDFMQNFCKNVYEFDQECYHNPLTVHPLRKCLSTIPSTWKSGCKVQIVTCLKKFMNSENSMKNSPSAFFWYPMPRRVPLSIVFHTGSLSFQAPETKLPENDFDD